MTIIELIAVNVETIFAGCLFFMFMVTAITVVISIWGPPIVIKRIIDEED